MTTKEVIAKLKEDAKTRPALLDVLHMFALRQRARHVLTLDALVLKMTEEKFTHQREDYADAIRCLSEAGVGTLELDKYSKVKGLKAIRYRIPQLGEAFFGGADKVREYKRPLPYEPVFTPPPVNPPSVLAPQKTSIKSTVENIVLTFIFNGKALNIPLPASMSPSDIAEFITRLKEDKSEKGPRA